MALGSQCLKIYKISLPRNCRVGQTNAVYNENKFVRYSGGLGIKIDSGETKKSAQFWADNKIFISYGAKLVQAAQIFIRLTQGLYTCRPTSYSVHPWNDTITADVVSFQYITIVRKL